MSQPLTLQDILSAAQAQLQYSEIPSARLDAELIVAHVLQRDRSWILAHTDHELSPDDSSKILALTQRRANHEPLVHLTGQREFYGLKLAITPDVLTPRVETEQMVEWALKYTPTNASLVDIGTGSGAIAIAIARHRSDIQVTATEVSPSALALATNNAIAHDVDIKFFLADLWTPLVKHEALGTFDCVVTNLPYLRDDARAELMPEVRHEPDIALFGGSDGLDLYRRFLNELPAHLAPSGYLFTECDPWQHEELIAEAARFGLHPVEQGYFILGFQRA